MPRAFQGFKLSPRETEPAYVGWDQGQCNPGTSTSPQVGTPIAQKSENMKNYAENKTEWEGVQGITQKMG